MRKIQLLAVIGLVFAWVAVARADTAPKSASVTVISVQGEARYSTDGKEWHPLVVGKILHEGAVIETAEGSSCNLVLSGTQVPVSVSSSAPGNMAMISQAPDPNVRGYEAFKPIAKQNVIRMSSGTMLAVDKLTTMDTGADTVGDTELDLRAGKVFFNVKKMSADSQFIIKLPNGVAGIRGTWGTLSADDSASCGDGEIILSLITGDGQSHVIIVHGAHGYDPQTGQVYVLSPGVMQALEQLENGTATLTVQLVSVGDITKIYISPTQGDQGQNNNNQGQNQGG